MDGILETPKNGILETPKKRIISGKHLKHPKFHFIVGQKWCVFFFGNPWKLSFPQQVHRFARVGAGVDETLQAFEGFVGSDGEIHIWLASERKHNIDHSSISIIKNQKSIHQKIIHRKFYPSKHLIELVFVVEFGLIFFKWYFLCLGTYMQHVLMATFSYKNLLHQTGEP